MVKFKQFFGCWRQIVWVYLTILWGLTIQMLTDLELFPGQLFKQCFVKLCWQPKAIFFIARKERWHSDSPEQFFFCSLLSQNILFTIVDSRGHSRNIANLFLPNIPFWYPWKYQKTKGFQMFSGRSKSNW